MACMGVEEFHPIAREIRRPSRIRKVLSEVLHDARVGGIASWVQCASLRQGCSPEDGSLTQDEYTQSRGGQAYLDSSSVGEDTQGLHR